MSQFQDRPEDSYRWKQKQTNPISVKQIEYNLIYIVLGTLRIVCYSF